MLPLLALLAGCADRHSKDDAQDSAPAGWPEGLAPVQDCDFGSPDASSEALWLTSEEGEPGFVCAKGYVQVPLSDVLPALAEPAVFANRRTAAEWSYELHDPPAFDVGFTLTLLVEDVVDVELMVEVNGGLIGGSEAAPEHFAMRWEKVDGTPFIFLMESSLQARAVDESTTELEIIERLHGARDGIAPSVAYVQDLYADILAVSHHEDLPTYP